MKKTNEEGRVLIEEVGVCDFYDIGQWSDSYSTIKLGYYDENYKAKYSDIAFCIKNEKGIFGYFITYNIVNIDKNEIIPLYSRKLVLYDFAVDSNSYAKYGKMLIDHLLNYAINNGYKAIEIKKIDKYQFFFSFLNRHYQLTEDNNSFYLLIDNPIIDDSKKHLVLYDDDKIKIDDLYFLNNLGFSILKKTIKLELINNEKIIIDRISGIIEFPSNVKILNDEVILNADTRNIVYMVWEMYDRNQIKNIKIDYKKVNPNYFEIYEDNILYVNKSLQTLFDDIKYVLLMIDKGVKKIYPYEINYDMNSNSLSHSIGGIVCDKLIENYTSTCDLNIENRLEIINEKELNKKFNEKITDIKKIDFVYDNGDSKKKLSIIFNDKAIILKDNNIKSIVEENKDDIIKILKQMNFYYWKKYHHKLNSKTKNTWMIKLTFENEEIVYSGIDSYPNIWIYVEWFIEKYYN